jgi:phosphatidylserine/phosphatidylglycerophosphate/cardiolipin synthase-like enzyme
VSIEPADGYRSLDDLIAGARRTIDMSMYELADPRAQVLLVAAHRRGVSVRVLLDRAYRGMTANRAAFAQLRTAGVPVRWASGPVLLHQKTVTVDDRLSAVMTGNLTSRHYPSTRDFVIVDRSPEAVSAIESVFADDWRGEPVAGGPPAAGLVWSPGAQGPLVGLVDSARHSLVVENEEMDAPVLESALEAAARRGVDVRLIMTAAPEWRPALAALTHAGVRVGTTTGPNATYIHAKAIVADDSTAFVGSQNFSSSSLDANRELGLVTSDPAVVEPVWRTLEEDFARAATVS